MESYTVSRQTETEELVERIKAYINIRWILLLFLVTVGLGIDYGLHGYTKTTTLSLGLALIALGINGVLWQLSHLSQTDRASKIIGLFQLVMDIALATSIIVISDDPSSPALIFYIIPIAISAALFEGMAVYALAVVSSLAYGAALVLISDQYAITGNISAQVAFYGLGLVVIAYIINTFYGLNRRRATERAQTEMISLTSHQLRTPATAVKGLLSLLLEDGQQMTDEQKDFIRRASEENERELKLIEHLLLVAKLDIASIKTNPKDTDPSELIERVVTDFKPVAAWSKQSLKFEQPKSRILVHMDPDHLRMILDNLVSNAINYSGPSSNIVVRLAERSSETLLSVEDNGEGIPRSERANLFRRFSRLKTGRQTVQGAGLGLYIIKKLAEINRVKITLVSYPGEGTIFTLSIPKPA